MRSTGTNQFIPRVIVIFISKITITQGEKLLGSCDEQWDWEGGAVTAVLFFYFYYISLIKLVFLFLFSNLNLKAQWQQCMHALIYYWSYLATQVCFAKEYYFLVFPPNQRTTESNSLLCDLVLLLLVLITKHSCYALLLWWFNLNLIRKLVHWFGVHAIVVSGVMVVWFCAWSWNIYISCLSLS